MSARSIALWCCAALFVASACAAVWFLAIPSHGFGLFLATPAALFLLVLVPVGFGLATLTLALSRRYSNHSTGAAPRSDYGGAR